MLCGLRFNMVRCRVDCTYYRARNNDYISEQSRAEYLGQYAAVRLGEIGISRSSLLGFGQDANQDLHIGRVLEGESNMQVKI